MFFGSEFFFSSPSLNLMSHTQHRFHPLSYTHCSNHLPVCLVHLIILLITYVVTISQNRIKFSWPISLPSRSHVHLRKHWRSMYGVMQWAWTSHHSRVLTLGISHIYRHERKQLGANWYINSSFTQTVRLSATKRGWLLLGIVKNRVLITMRIFLQW